MTTLVSACYRILILTDSERVCASYRIGRLRVPADSQVTIAKGGVVDKSRAFAPTYPQFVMKKSDLRSSCFWETKIVSAFFH